MSEHYEGAGAVRAMLDGKDLDLTDTAIDSAAGALGWPGRDPHPFLVAERIEKAAR